MPDRKPGCNFIAFRYYSTIGKLQTKFNIGRPQVVAIITNIAPRVLNNCTALIMYWLCERPLAYRALRRATVVTLCSPTVDCGRVCKQQ